MKYIITLLALSLFFSVRSKATIISRGGLRNDMGAFGGPFASIIPFTPSFTGIFSLPVRNEKASYIRTRLPDFFR